MLQFTFFTLFLCSQYAAGIPVSTSVYSQEADVWMRLHIVPATWTVAAVQCQLEGGVLATPTTSAIAEKMLAAMNEIKLSSVYIGVTESFSKGDYKSLDGAAVADIPLEWAAGEPNNANKSEHCLALTGAGALADVSCSLGLPYFCRKQFTQVANSTTVVPPCNDKKGTQYGANDGAYVYSREADAWLRLHMVPAAWSNAGMRCFLEGGVLASPTNSAMAQVMVAMMVEHQLTHSVFTGINSILVKDNFTSVEGVPFADMQLKWAAGEPNNASSDEQCLAMDGAGALADISCDSALPYFCRKEVANKCGPKDNGYKYEPRTGSCYKFHRIASTWRQAVVNCNFQGGYLAIINDATESTVLKEIYDKISANNIIGAEDKTYAFVGFRKWDDGVWATVYGTPLSEAGFTGWATGEPNNGAGKMDESCGSIYRINGLINDAPCNQKCPFICEMNPK